MGDRLRPDLPKVGRAESIDVGGRGAAWAALGYVLEGVNEDLLDLDAATYERMLAQVLTDFPELAIAAATLRQVQTASVNDWSGVCLTRTSFHVGPWMGGLEATLGEVRRLAGGRSARVIR